MKMSLLMQAPLVRTAPRENSLFLYKCYFIIYCISDLVCQAVMEFSAILLNDVSAKEKMSPEAVINSLNSLGYAYLSYIFI
jgi:hypothetical protein